MEEKQKVYNFPKQFRVQWKWSYQSRIPWGQNKVSKVVVEVKFAIMDARPRVKYLGPYLTVAMHELPKICLLSRHGTVRALSSRKSGMMLLSQLQSPWRKRKCRHIGDAFVFTPRFIVLAASVLVLEEPYKAWCYINPILSSSSW
jgi:hypothetical protein